MLVLNGVLVCITSATDLKSTDLNPATSHMDRAEKPAGIFYFVSCQNLQFAEHGSLHTC